MFYIIWIVSAFVAVAVGHFTLAMLDRKKK